MNYGAVIFGLIVAGTIDVVSDYTFTNWQWWVAVVALNTAGAICYG